MLTVRPSMNISEPSIAPFIVAPDTITPEEESSEASSLDAVLFSAAFAGVSSSGFAEEASDALALATFLEEQLVAKNTRLRPRVAVRVNKDFFTIFLHNNFLQDNGFFFKSYCLHETRFYILQIPVRNAVAVIVPTTTAFALHSFSPLGALYTERNFLLFRPGTNDTKTVVAVAVVRVVAAPVGDGAAVVAADPAATAYDAVRTGRGTRRW